MLSESVALYEFSNSFFIYEYLSGCLPCLGITVVKYFSLPGEILVCLQGFLAVTET